MSMPNCVPQSPTWLTRSTSWPQNSSTRQMESPMIVERRWPACISLATFGDEKSTTTFCVCTGGGSAPFCAIVFSRSANHGPEMVMLMKPAPATSTLAIMASESHSCIASASRCATSFGDLMPSGRPAALRRPKSESAELFW